MAQRKTRTSKQTGAQNPAQNPTARIIRESNYPDALADDKAFVEAVEKRLRNSKKGQNILEPWRTLDAVSKELEIRPLSVDGETGSAEATAAAASPVAAAVRDGDAAAVRENVQDSISKMESKGVSAGTRAVAFGLGISHRNAQGLADMGWPDGDSPVHQTRRNGSKGYRWGELPKVSSSGGGSDKGLGSFLS